jgi:hypothetical protein
LSETRLSIRAEIERDQADPSKWVMAPEPHMMRMEMLEIAPDQTRAQEQARQMTEYHKTQPVMRIFNPKTGETKYRYTSDDKPILVTDYHYKRGVTREEIEARLRPQLRADRSYVEALIKRHFPRDGGTGSREV